MTTRQLIKSTKGKVFTATFIKKNGETRKMTARLGVRKGVKGVGLKFSPEEKGLVTVYDMTIREHRMINLATLTNFKCGKLNWSK